MKANDNFFKGCLAVAIASFTIFAIGYPARFGSESAPTRTKGRISHAKPIIGYYNGFHENLNVIECANPHAEQLRLRLRAFDNDGEEIATDLLEIVPWGTYHFILNQYPIADSYGIYTLTTEVQSNGDWAQPACFTAIYRLSDKGAAKAVEYAFSLPPFSPLTGVNAGTYNSIDPSGQGVRVFNWLSVFNPGRRPFFATVDLYAQDTAGTPFQSFRVQGLRPGERYDYPIGHPDGEVVGLYVIRPDEPETEYGAFLSRYSIDPDDDQRFRFAFPLLTLPGTCNGEFLPASTMNPASAYAVIGNAESSPTDVLFEVRAQAGNIIHSEVIHLGPYAQSHLHLNPYLGDNSLGSFRVLCEDETTKLLAESMYYGRLNSETLAVENAYAVQMRDTPATRQFVSHVNTNLGAANWFRAFNDELTDGSLEYGVHSTNGVLIGSGMLEIEDGTSESVGLHEVAPANFAGSLFITGPEGSSVKGELLRVFPHQSGNVGYVMPIPMTYMNAYDTEQAPNGPEDEAPRGPSDDAGDDENTIPTVPIACAFLEVEVDSSVTEPIVLSLPCSSLVGDSLSYTVYQHPGHGVLIGEFTGDVRAMSLSYLPSNDGFSGEDVVTFKVSDRSGNNTILATLRLNLEHSGGDETILSSTTSTTTAVTTTTLPTSTTATPSTTTLASTTMTTVVIHDTTTTLAVTTTTLPPETTTTSSTPTSTTIVTTTTEAPATTTTSTSTTTVVIHDTTTTAAVTTTTLATTTTSAPSTTTTTYYSSSSSGGVDCIRQGREGAIYDSLSVEDCLPVAQ